MRIRLVQTVTFILLGGVLDPAEAAIKEVRVPSQYDGSWSILAKTASGLCSASKRYQVTIKNSDASIVGEDIGIDGGVSADGAVQIMIVKGSNRLPITGHLDAKGRGSGTWQATGGLVECSGRWTAERAD